MKKFLLLLLSTTFIISCKKENPIPVNKEYETEIFSGQDTLIYGEWKYLYSYGGWGGTRNNADISILSIRHIGKYAIIFNENDIAKGIIYVGGKRYDRTEIIFHQEYQSGNKKIFLFPQSIYFSHPDTLILEEPCCDMNTYYFARIK
ncbi:MAG: hypothetical protein ACM3Q2_15075 [Syntrophothermus sp.]